MNLRGILKCSAWKKNKWREIKREGEQEKKRDVYNHNMTMNEMTYTKNVRYGPDSRDDGHSF